MLNSETPPKPEIPSIPTTEPETPPKPEIPIDVDTPGVSETEEEDRKGPGWR